MGVKPRVLVVDDDFALAEMLGIVLRTDGFEPAFVSDGSRALHAFRETKPDVVLLDLMLPGLSGIDVCRAIRAESGTPIIMLTAKSDTVDIVLGLESGADDYVVKPFKPKELLARIRARVRRLSDATPESLAIGDLVIDVAGYEARLRGRKLDLTHQEFELLRFLAQNRGKVYTREQLLQKVWGYRYYGGSRTVDIHVRRVRAKLGAVTGGLVETVRNVGYKMRGGERE